MGCTNSLPSAFDACGGCCQAYQPGELDEDLLPEASTPTTTEATNLLEPDLREVTDEHASFTHCHGVIAALEAMKLRGDADIFEPLRAEFERAIVELTEGEFESLVNNRDLKVECKGDPTSGLVIIKSIDLVPGADPEELFWLTHDVERRAAWEKKSKFSTKSCSLLDERVGGTDQTWLFQYPGVFFVKGREFVDRRIISRDPDRKLWVCVMGAGQSAAAKESSSYVRGETCFQVSVVYQTPTGAAHFLIILSDPKGSIPPKLVSQQCKAHPMKWHKVLLKAHAEMKEADQIQRSASAPQLHSMDD